MKKIITIMVLLAMFSANIMAADFIKGKFYGGIGLGLEDFSTYSSYDPGITLILNAGKPVIKLGPGTIGGEVEFTYTIIPMSYSRYSHWDLSVMTLGTYATYTYNHSKTLYSRAKLGFAFQNYSWDYGRDDYGYDYDYRHVNVAAGIGGGYHLNKTLRVYSDLIFIGSSLKQFNFGLQMNF